MLNMTHMSEMFNAGKSNAGVVSKAGSQVPGTNRANRNKKKDHMYQFVDWNFSRRNRVGKKKP